MSKMPGCRFVVQPVIDYEIQPMITIEKKSDALSDFFGAPETSEVANKQTSTRITLTDDALTDGVYVNAHDHAKIYAKLHKNTGCEIFAFLFVLFVLALLVVALKQSFEF